MSPTVLRTIVQVCIRSAAVTSLPACSAEGAGVHVSDGTETYDTDPLFTRCRFKSNLAELLGGGVFVDGPGGGRSGGAVYVASGGSGTLTFTRCGFNNNTSQGDGGGVYVNGSSGTEPQFTNCLFYRNVADNGANPGVGRGGAIWAKNLVELINCTFAKNHAGQVYGAGAIYHDVPSNPPHDSSMDNCILWRNTAAGNHLAEADQIVVTTGEYIGGMDVFNTCIEDLDPNGEWTDPSNTAVDPLFTSLNNDNYVLLDTGCNEGDCDSHSIDEGNNAKIDCDAGDLVLNDRCVELEGVDTINDMGCLETPAP